MNTKPVMILTLILVPGPLALAAPKPDKIVVATWNLEWFFDADPSDQKQGLPKEKKAPSQAEFTWKLNGIAAAIADMNPTILALQEVEDREILDQLVARLKQQHNLEYNICFVEGRDSYTEQDVAILSTYEHQSCGRRWIPWPLEKDKQNYKTLTKHIVAEYAWGYPVAEERLTVIAVHLIASGGAVKRMKQGRSVRFWVDQLVAFEENVIVLGDFNSGKDFGDNTTRDSGVGVIRGLVTDATDDDLYDLHNELSAGDRETHLNGGQYDRILISTALTTDFEYKDLVFDAMHRRKNVVIRGQGQDSSHGSGYWQIPQAERDLSDHFPLAATFKFVK